MPINTRHPEYEKALPSWVKCSDFVAGSEAVKSKGSDYLPNPNMADKTPEAEVRYKNYLNRTVFYEYSADQIDKYVGLAFKSDPVCELDESLEYLKRNADGSGVSLYQQAQKGFVAQLTTARFGLFVDYPSVNSKLSKAEQDKLNIKPKTLFYDAKSIINWQVGTINNEVVPTLIVLYEQVSEPDADDPFTVKPIDQWRYLGLDDVGYFVEVWRKDKDGEFVIHVPRLYPKNGKGQNWSFVPFQIFGSKHNTWDIQKIPMEKIVNIEQGVYINSADAENSSFYCGHIQATMNIDQQTIDVYAERDEKGEYTGRNKVKLGSGEIIMLGENGSFQYAQASPNTMATDGIEKKREIIAELGANLGQARSGNKTATQSDNEQQAQHSVASLCVANINEGMFNVLTWCNEYMGVTTEPKFLIKQDFSTKTIDTNLLNTLSALVDGGKLPKTALYNKAREWGLVDGELSDEDMDDLIEGQMGGFGVDDE